MTEPAPPPRDPQPTPAGAARRPGLDSVRGLAVAAVVAYHLGYLSGGFLGVDVFFVLSGYLVTGLALSERDETGSLGLRAFWGRRVRRLAPALFVVVPAVVAAAVAFDWDRTVFDRLGWDATATLSWWANWREAFGGDGGYWSSAPSLFRHAWSLAVEEQFYLLWPLVLTGAFALAARRRAAAASTVAAVGAALAAASATWALVLAHRLGDADLSRVYVGTDTRIVTPLVGCVLAALLHPRHPLVRPRRAPAPAVDPDSAPSPDEPGTAAWARAARAAGLVAAVALAVLVARVEVADPALYRRGLLPAAAVLAAVVVLGAGTLGRTEPVTAWLGRRSYAIYLWSWPIQQILHRWRPGASRGEVAVATVAAALVLAEVSWWMVERPAQRRLGWAARPVGRRVVAAVLVGVAVASVAVAFRLDRLNLLGEAPEAATALEHARQAPPTAPPGSPGHGGDRVLLTGDSVAFTLGYLAPPIGETPGIASLDPAGLIGCGQLASDGYRHRTLDDAGWDEIPPVCAVQDEVEQLGLDRRPDVLLVQTGTWEWGDQLAPDGTVLAARSPALTRVLVDDLVHQAGRADAVGARTLFLAYACPGPRTEPAARLDPAHVAWMADVLDRAATEAGERGYRAEVLRPTAEVCEGGDPTAAPTPAKDSAFDHEVHVRTPEGGRWAWERWLGPAVVASR